MDDIEKAVENLIKLDLQAALEDSLIVAQAKAIRIYKAKLEFLLEVIERPTETYSTNDAIHEELLNIEETTD